MLCNGAPDHGKSSRSARRRWARANNFKHFAHSPAINLHVARRSKCPFFARRKAASAYGAKLSGKHYP
jgi:hypothetical protein